MNAGWHPVLAIAVLAFTLAPPDLGAAADADDAKAAASARPCKRATVGGRRVCLRTGQRCRERYQPDYLRARFDCRGRLRRASLEALRRGRPVALGSSGVPTLRQALAAFDQQVADLPGVTPARGEVGAATSGTAAIDWLSGHLADLTGEQRAVFDSVVAPHDDAVPVDAPPAPVEPPTPGSPIPPGPSALGARVLLQQPPMDPDLADFLIHVTEGRARLMAKGLVFPHPITARLNPETTNYAETSAQWLHGTGNNCEIAFGPPGLAQNTAGRRQIALHELMHCAMGEATTVGASSFKKAWISEGLPNWAAARVAIEWQGSAPTEPGLWKVALRSSPDIDLYTRAYDAQGFWALMEHAGVDLWPLVPEISRLEDNSDAVYRLVTGRATGDWRSDWGSTMITHAPFGRRWDLDGPGMVRGLAPDRFPIANGSEEGTGVDRRGARALVLGLTADVLFIRSGATARVVLRDKAGSERQLPSPTTIRLCARPAGCVCKNGRRLPFPTIARGPVSVGIADQVRPSNVSFRGESLAGHCDESEAGKKDQGDKGPPTGPGPAVGGIQLRGPLFSEDENEPQLLTRFRSASCRLRGNRFRAVSRSGGWMLEVNIANFNGFHNYPAQHNNPSSNVIVKGRLGTFSTLYSPPGGAQEGGVITFLRGGRILGVGAAPVFNNDFTSGVALGGAMSCSYPRRPPG